MGDEVKRLADCEYRKVGEKAGLAFTGADAALLQAVITRARHIADRELLDAFAALDERLAKKERTCP